MRSIVVLSLGRLTLPPRARDVLCRHHVPLLQDVDGFLDEVASRMPASKKAQASAWRMFNMRKQ